MSSLDPRLHPFRPDVAASYLKGQVEAGQFVDGVPCTVMAGFARVTGSPQDDARQTTQLLFGETFVVYDEADGWAWGQNQTDKYVGYVRVEALTPEQFSPTHRVGALRSDLYHEPDLKTPIIDVFSMTSPVSVVSEKGRWVEIAGGGWLYAQHLSPACSTRPDIIATARMFLNTPYQWGGRTSIGLDCSALVQLCLSAAGMECPRDSDQQARSVGRKISDNGQDVVYQAGDIVFFPGHVGFMTGSTNLIHANAFHMAVVDEPLADVVSRGAAITAVRRLG